MKYYLAPSILPVEVSKLGEAVKGLLDGGVKWIQIDVMDGNFVPNLTYGPCMVESVRNLVPDDIIVDAHLMIERPEVWATDYVNAGANVVTVHVEATRHLHKAIQGIKEKKAMAGAAVNPATPVQMLFDVLGDIDLALVMSVNPGFGGQKFIPSALNKIRQLRKAIDETKRDIQIQVDGGIKLDNIEEAAAAGATNFVSGSGVFSDKDIKKINFKSVVAAFNEKIAKGASRK